MSAAASQRFIRNASFSQGTPSGATASPTDITSWTSDITVNGTNYEIIGGTGVNGYYRDFPGDTTPLALRLQATGTTTLSQNLETLRSSFRTDVPYYCQVAWRRKGTADGTLTLRLGAVTAAVDITTGVADAWNVLRIALGTGCWYQNFGQAALTFSIARTSATTGDVDIDDIILSPMANFDGSWYAIVGSQTQFLLDDSFTMADNEYGLSQAVPQGVLSAWLYRTIGRYLPTKPTAPLTACTIALAGAGAGSITAGTHSVKVTFVTALSESAPSATSNVLDVTNPAADGRIAVTAIPLGPTGTTSRKLFMTTTGNTQPWKLITTIANNTDTTVTLNTADGSLGAAVGAAVTVSDPA